MNKGQERKAIENREGGKKGRHREGCRPSRKSKKPKGGDFCFNS